MNYISYAQDLAETNRSILVSCIETKFVDTATNSNKFYNVFIFQNKTTLEFTVYRHYGRSGTNTSPQPIMATLFKHDAMAASTKALQPELQKGYKETNNYAIKNCLTEDDLHKTVNDDGKGSYVASENNQCYLLCRKQADGNTYLSCYEESKYPTPWRTCAVAVNDIKSCDETYFIHVALIEGSYEGLQKVVILGSIEDIEDVGLEEKDCLLPQK